MGMPEDAALRDAILQRLKFEGSLGLETVHPLALSPATPPPAPARAPVPAQVVASPGPASVLEEPAAPAEGAAARPASLEDEIAKLTPEQKEQRWEALTARALACKECPLHAMRNKVVFGEVNRHADVVFVGEGPGADEDRTGRPFVGKAGQLLDKVIKAMGLERKDVYICNVVKCRPPENRTPSDEEAAACWPYLEEQLALIHPKVIVALGAPATKRLLRINQGISHVRGRWHLYRGIRVMPTFHPAFVLRQYTEQVRRQVWDDVQQVMAYLKEEKA
jgi:uracil-DNA glycosylase family 4